MRTFVLFFIVVLRGCHLASAQNGFMIHLDSIQAGRNGGAHSVREVPDGYLVFSHQFSHDGTGKMHVFTRRLDMEGNYLHEHEFTYGDNRHYDLGRIDPVAYGPDGTFVAAVPEGWGYTDSTWLYTFNEAGERVGRHFLYAFAAEDSITHSIKQVRRTADGGYAMAGFFSPLGMGGSRAYLVRLNVDGDTIYTRRYGGANTAHYALTLDEYVDGGFVISGYRTGPNDQCFLIRTGSNGDQQWVRYYGGYGVQNGGENGGVKVTTDGGVVTWAYYRENGWPPYHNQLMLTKWDAAGDIEWQRKSHYGYYRFAYDLELLPDGSFIGTAYGAEAGLNAMLCKFSSTGDSLWTRGYSMLGGHHELFDVEPTSDGGFVATGIAWRYPPLDPDIQQTQTIWVVKTDSLGCVVPGCQLVGVEEYVMDLNEHLRIWPNPVARGTPLQLSFSPPPTFTPNGPLRVVLLDATGRQVHEESIGTGAGTRQLANLPLAAGLYYLHLIDNSRWLAGGKVVVE